MRSLSDLFEEYSDEICEMDTAFSTYDGWFYLGGIIDVRENSLFIFLSGPLAPDEPIEVKLDEIDMNTLRHYSESERKWKSAAWDEEKGRWIITDWNSIIDAN